MNKQIRNNIVYYYESYWAPNGKSLVDANGNKYPIPKLSTKEWAGKEQFEKKLIHVQNYLKSTKKFIEGTYSNSDCLLCSSHKITSGSYNLNNTLWENGLTHYIQAHNIKPSSEFIDMIYQFNPIISQNKRTIKYKSKSYTIDNIKYIKLQRNQIMILDALMTHGGYTRKYIDQKKNIYRYSEHAGLLDFNSSGIDRIVISGKTNRVDKGDEEIYLPKNMPDALDYEYIFHTHPPTPKPGGRVDIGILYEFPSVSDIFHFIDHHNEGTTQGSLVIAPEGVYNIRKLVFDLEKIFVNENKLFKQLQDVMGQAQFDSIEKYGEQFTTYEFYSKIAQDTKYIKMINKVLNKYRMQIDYYPRVKDDKGKWIIDTLYLPVCVIE